MINELSILIPTYNKVCVKLVKALHAQASSLPGLNYEIIVADDGSNVVSTVNDNRAINDLAGCRYIVREENAGRAAIRNYLARQAKYKWLLFIDSNMDVISDDYISRYINNVEETDVVYGGYKINTAQVHLRHNLRYMFETTGVQNGNHLLRQANPYRDFHTSNFIIRRTVMQDNPFDERFKFYGYEDVLFGKKLKEGDIPILHVDNPLGYDNFMDNASFVCKSEEACRTLYQFRDELRGYAKILDYADKLQECHLYPLCHMLFCIFHKPMRSILVGNRPSMFLFNLYKLLYYIQLSLK